jgi:hypothetical protein
MFQVLHIYILEFTNMATTTIDSRGVVTTDGGEGFNVNTSTVISASVGLSGSASHRGIAPYTLSTTLLSSPSGTISWGGHYTISMSNGSNAAAMFVMPTLASSVGSTFIVRNMNQLAHQLTGSEVGTVAVFTTGSLTGSAVVASSVTAGSRLELPFGHSVIVMNTGDRFAAVGISGGALQIRV